MQLLSCVWEKLWFIFIAGEGQEGFTSNVSTALACTHTCSYLWKLSQNHMWTEKFTRCFWRASLLGSFGHWELCWRRLTKCSEKPSVGRKIRYVIAPNCSVLRIVLKQCDCAQTWVPEESRKVLMHYLQIGSFPTVWNSRGGGEHCIWETKGPFSCGLLPSGNILSGYFFFSLSSSMRLWIVPKATLPTCNYSTEPGWMLQWIWARCWVSSQYQGRTFSCGPRSGANSAISLHFKLGSLNTLFFFFPSES